MKVKCPRPGELEKLDGLWNSMTSAEEDIRDAFRRGAVEAEEFKRLWSGYQTARTKYEEAAAAIPVVELPG